MNSETDYLLPEVSFEGIQASGFQHAQDERESMNSFSLNLSENQNDNYTAPIDISSECSDIVVIFVAAFDTKLGNIIEWSCPPEVDLSGVEFKAVVSGAHHLDSDFVYFQKSLLYGLACYGQLHTGNISERGTRIKAIGVIAHSYSTLHLHQDFLETQVKQLLNNPGDYIELETYYKKKMKRPNTPPFDSLTLQLNELPHIADDFLNTFDERIFVFWKLTLLQKRILFCTDPPIGRTCNWVLCCASMAEQNIPTMVLWKPKPVFYVNVAGMDWLKFVPSYIACTTETVFKFKEDLYDVFIDHSDIRHAHHFRYAHLLRPTKGDKQRLDLLRGFLYSSSGVVGSNESSSGSRLQSFFRHLNNRLLGGLIEISQSEEPTMTQFKVTELGLDPDSDQDFLRTLIQELRLNVDLDSTCPCCPVIL